MKLQVFSDTQKPPRHGHMKETTAVVADVGGEQVWDCTFLICSRENLVCKFYTASADKSLKIWDLRSRRRKPFGYARSRGFSGPARCMETLLGHVDAVTSLDLLVKPEISGISSIQLLLELFRS